MLPRRVGHRDRNPGEDVGERLVGQAQLPVDAASPVRARGRRRSRAQGRPSRRARPAERATPSRDARARRRVPEVCRGNRPVVVRAARVPSVDANPPERSNRIFESAARTNRLAEPVRAKPFAIDPQPGRAARAGSGNVLCTTDGSTPYRSRYARAIASLDVVRNVGPRQDCPLDSQRERVLERRADARRLAVVKVFEIERVRDAQPRGGFGDRRERAGRPAIDKVCRLAAASADEFAVHAAERASDDERTAIASGPRVAATARAARYPRRSSSTWLLPRRVDSRSSPSPRPRRLHLRGPSPSPMARDASRRRERRVRRRRAHQPPSTCEGTSTSDRRSRP